MSIIAFLSLAIFAIIPLPVAEAAKATPWYDVSISGWALVLLVVGMLFPRTRTSISEIFSHVGNGVISVGTSTLKAVGLIHSKTPPPTTPASAS